MEKKETNTEPIEQKNVIWGSRKKLDKVSVHIGLNRSPSHKPILDLESGEYEYWLRSNESLFNLTETLSYDLSNFFNKIKFGGDDITYLDFQQLGFKVEHYDDTWCTFKKRTNDSEVSGKYYFKTKHLMIANWIDNEGENMFNGKIHSKKFLFEILLSIGSLTEQEVFGVGDIYF